MPHDFDQNSPIYLQIIRLFEAKIARGAFESGARLPSVRETAIQYHVNPNTVQRAYQEMERSGVVVTIRGQGSYVTSAPQVIARLRDTLAQETMDRFVSDMSSLGFATDDLAKLLETFAATAKQAPQNSATEGDGNNA